MNQTGLSDTDTYAGTGSLTEGEYHRLVAVRRRRTTLVALSELNHPVDLDGLAAAVGKREMGRAALDETTITQIATELHHVHLPKMDTLGVIDYDQETNCVTSGP